MLSRDYVHIHKCWSLVSRQGARAKYYHKSFFKQNEQLVSCKCRVTSCPAGDSLCHPASIPYLCETQVLHSSKINLKQALWQPLIVVGVNCPLILPLIGIGSMYLPNLVRTSPHLPICAGLPVRTKNPNWYCREDKVHVPAAQSAHNKKAAF